ncbi:MAG: hypothetical protein NTW86_08270 [Candidatus Sumerlaeota bacterium]|nr:hypothetical protein [Candidatus Sumerlaeota bacterium]
MSQTVEVHIVGTSWAPILGLVLVALLLLSFLTYRQWIQSSRGRSALLAAISLGVGLAVAVWRGVGIRNAGFLANSFEAPVPSWLRSVGIPNSDAGVVICLLGAGLSAMLAVLWGVFLHDRWIGGAITEAERRPDAEGFRAWLTPGRIVLAALISLSAWAGFGVSIWAALAVCLGSLAAYPAIHTLSQPTAVSAAPVSEDLSAERERVLNLLEAGKITAEESAELLSALAEGARAAAAAPTVPATPGRRLLLAGAAVLLVGFFLPWFRINPGAELGRALQLFPEQLRYLGEVQRPATEGQRQMGQLTPTPQQRSISLNGPTVSVSGGQMSNGLGWIVLALGLAAAILPYVAAGLRRPTQQTVAFLALGAGAIILLYLLSNNLRWVSYGLLTALAGYALEIAGALRDRREAA